MIKIELITPAFLISNKTTKKGTEILVVEYDKPVTVRKLLKDTNIQVEFLGLIMLNAKNINQNFILNNSCQIKLFPLLGGG